MQNDALMHREDLKGQKNTNIGQYNKKGAGTSEYGIGTWELTFGWHWFNRDIC